MAIEAINSTTYSANNLGDVKPKIKIGGDDKNKFIPNINVSFFDDEFYFNLNRKDKVVTDEIASIYNNKLSQTIDNETDEYRIDENGHLKWDIVFNSIPDKKKIEFEIECSEKLEFYYQDELTEEEIKDGCIRPENVIGSYAVYCNKKNNKYKTGKICHIYRALFVDAKGDQIWQYININNNKLTIPLPLEWLKKAVYPVRLDPTFGYTSIGSSAHYQYNSDNPWGWGRQSPYTASSGDTITKFSAYGANLGTSTILNVVPYTVSGGDLVSRVGIAIEIPITAGSGQWWDSGAVSIALSNGISYGIGFECYGEAGGIALAYDNTGEGTRHNMAEPLPVTWVGNLQSSRTFSIYATYATGGGTTTNIDLQNSESNLLSYSLLADKEVASQESQSDLLSYDLNIQKELLLQESQSNLLSYSLLINKEIDLQESQSNLLSYNLLTDKEIALQNSISELITYNILNSQEINLLNSVCELLEFTQQYGNITIIDLQNSVSELLSYSLLNNQDINLQNSQSELLSYAENIVKTIGLENSVSTLLDINTVISQQLDLLNSVVELLGFTQHYGNITVIDLQESQSNILDVSFLSVFALELLNSICQELAFQSALTYLFIGHYDVSKYLNLDHIVLEKYLDVGGIDSLNKYIEAGHKLL